MWVVKGKTVNGKDVEYKVPAGKDTDKAFVMALAFQEHGKAEPDDALTAETTVTWTSDNVMNVGPIAIAKRQNFGVDKRIAKGVWARHSQRAYRTIESATEALESAASEYPNDKFRITATTQVVEVVAQSKNVMQLEATEEPDKPKEETTATTGETTPADSSGDSPSVSGAPSNGSKRRTPKAA